MLKNGEIKTMTRYFEKTPVEFIENDGNLWITMEAVGKALGYSNPTKAISNLISRYPDEFKGFTSFLKVRNEGDIQQRTITILSRDAINLVCMLARTEKAKTFRHWVLKILREVQTKGYYFDQPIQAPLLSPGKYEKALIKAEQQALQAQNKLIQLYDLTIDELEKKLTKMKAKAAKLHAPDENKDILLIKRNAGIRKSHKRPDDLITIARAFRRLYGRHSKTEISKMTGCSLAKIDNYLSLLSLEPEIINFLETRQLDCYRIFARTNLRDISSDLRISYVISYMEAKDKKERSKVMRLIDRR